MYILDPTLFLKRNGKPICEIGFIKDQISKLSQGVYLTNIPDKALKNEWSIPGGKLYEKYGKNRKITTFSYLSKNET